MKYLNQKNWCLSLLLITLICTTGCSKVSFSPGALGVTGLGSSDDLQKETFSFNDDEAQNKVDIIWMVDGSATMANHQANLAANFNSFISDFVKSGFDFRMVVASTDAWVREYDYNSESCAGHNNPTHNPSSGYFSSADCNGTRATYGDLTKFRDGDIYGSKSGAAGSRSGTYILTSDMNPESVKSTFATNIRVGIRGDGTRESTLQSLRSVLRRNSDGSVGYGGETYPELSSFRRPDAFLAVIAVSDEEDQGRRQDGLIYESNEEYVKDFTTFLDGYSGSTASKRKYNVSSIVVDDIAACKYGLHAQASQGDRYVAIAQQTQGVVASICSADFSVSLKNIAKQIVDLSSGQAVLKNVPIPGSIQVKIVPFDSSISWTVDRQTVRFNKKPKKGTQIEIIYLPTLGR